MRHSSLVSRFSSGKSAGFTLVEMLIIAPIAILIIGGFIALMVSMVGEVMQTRGETSMVYESQTALSLIEQDTQLSTQFLTSTKNVVSPQGVGDNFAGGGNFSNRADTLILQTLATDKNPNAPSSRNLIYYANQPNSCASPNKVGNQIFVNTVVYFIKDGSLWKRTIVPTNNTSATADANTVCDTPWQRNSCSPGSTAALCQSSDSEIMKDVESMGVTYYSSPANTGSPLPTANAATATAVRVSINGKKTVAGRTIELSQSILAAKLNTTPQNVGMSQLAISQQPLDRSAPVNSSNLTFTVGANYSTATFQWARSLNGGMTWSNVPGAITKTLTIPSASPALNRTKYRVTAQASGMTAVSTEATLSLQTQAWQPLTLQNSWVNYNALYGTPQYTQTGSGVVIVRGLIRNGIDAQYTVLATLPPGMRPSQRLIMPTSTSNNVTNIHARVDVAANGDIILVRGTNAWLAINLMFVPAGTNHAWEPVSHLNGWTNYESGYEPVRNTKDLTERIFIQGLLRPGVTATDTPMLVMPQSIYQPSGRIHFTAGYPTTSGFVIKENRQIVKRGNESVGHLGINANYMPNGYGQWSDLSLQNSWASYGGVFSTAKYTKTDDRIVTLEGLIRLGTTTGNTVIATLPPGYRPDARMIFNVYTNYKYGRIDVLPTGEVIVNDLDSTWASLNGISFIADQ